MRRTARPTPGQPPRTNSLATSGKRSKSKHLFYWATMATGAKKRPVFRPVPRRIVATACAANRAATGANQSVVIGQVRVCQRVPISIPLGPTGFPQRLLALGAMGRNILRFVGIRGHIFGRPLLDDEAMIRIAIRAPVFAERPPHDAGLHADHKGRFRGRNRRHFAGMEYESFLA